MGTRGDMPAKRGAKGEGSIQKLPSRKYRIRWINQRGKRVSATFPTEVAARRELRRILTDQENAKGRAETGKTTAELVREWLTVGEGKELEMTTVEGYRAKIDGYITYDPLWSMAAADVTPNDIRAFMGSLKDGSLQKRKRKMITKELKSLNKLDRSYRKERTRLEARLPRMDDDEKPLGNSIQRQCFSILAVAFKHGVQQGYIAANPTDAVSRPSLLTNAQRDGKLGLDIDPRRDSRRVFTKAERDRLYEVVERHRYRARFLLSLDLGLRPGECTALEWKHYDPQTGVLTIRQQLQHSREQCRTVVVPRVKTTSGDREIVLPQYLRQALDAHRRQQQIERADANNNWKPWIFNGRVMDLMFHQFDGEPMRATYDNDQWKAILKAANVVATRRYTARHTAGSVVIAAGGDIATVSKNMGHSSPQFTLQRYTHPVTEGEEAVANLLDLKRQRIDEELQRKMHPYKYDSDGCLKPLWMAYNDDGDLYEITDTRDPNFIENLKTHAEDLNAALSGDPRSA